MSSNFRKQLEQEFKNKKYDNLSADKKRDVKLNSLNEILGDIKNKDNRYIFYCPDIALVNPLVKLVYEVAYQAKLAGYNVVMLHELNGFKAKWLFECEDYKEFRNLPVEYVINKSSKKSKKTRNTYAFRASDTLVVTDAYQDMLENIMSEESLKLVQKIVLVTGYMGLASIQPGMDYDKLNVNSLVFFDENIKADYAKLFQTKNYLIDNYIVSKGFNRDVVKADEVYPVIGITSIGNNDKAQQLINVFYNRYPNLSMFTFKVVARDNMDMFIENVSTSAAIVVLDKNIITKQMIYECLNMGVTPILPKRREFMDNKVIVENFVVDDDVFEIADAIASYCQYWLTMSNKKIKSAMMRIADSLDLDSRTVEQFGSTVALIFSELQENRYLMFNNMKELIENEKA